MKKIIAIVLALVLCLSLFCACKKAEKTYTNEEVLNEVGLNLEAPEGATDVAYRVTTLADGKKTAEVGFIFDGVNYTYRAMPTGELVAQDLSEMKNTWKATETAQVSYCEATVNTDTNMGNVVWLDIVPGVDYTLFAVNCGEADTLVATANLVFVPTQGDAYGDGEQPPVYDYTGSFSDNVKDETAGNVIYFKPNDMGGYDVEITLKDLGKLTGVGSIDGCNVVFTVTEPGGKMLEGIFYPDSQEGFYGFRITKSEWDQLPVDTVFGNFQGLGSGDIITDPNA